MIDGASERSLLDKGVDLGQEAPVIVVKLIQGIAPVEEEVVVVEDRWNELDVVIDLGDIEHRLKF